MTNSTFQSVTGPTGPEGNKAVGFTGPDGITGVTGNTGSNAPHLVSYAYGDDGGPFGGAGGEGSDTDKVLLTFSDETEIFLTGLTGSNKYGTGTADATTYTSTPSSFKNVVTSGDGVTFQFRGITATNDLSLTFSDTEIEILGSAGTTTGYVDAGATGELLYLNPRYKANGADGTFYGASSDNTGTGDTVEVKFRNVIESIGNEFNIDWCNNPFDINDSGDPFKEYILDVSNLLIYQAGNSGIREATICITFSFFFAKDRIVMLKTRVDDPTFTSKLRDPLYGATSVNFENPISGIPNFINEGYGNDQYRRSIDDFNTPYHNPTEGYSGGIHPQTWSGIAGSDPEPCPTEQAIIFDSNCANDGSLLGAVFRGQEFCKLGQATEENSGQNPTSYCIRIDDTMVETQNVNDPWYGKLRLVIMPGCAGAGDGTEYNFIMTCDSECVRNEDYNNCCYTPLSERGNRTSSTSEGLSGTFNLVLSDNNVVTLNAPINITGINYKPTSESGLSLDSDDGVDYAQQKSATLVINGGPNNIKFPENVLFAKTPVFTNGVDIVNILTVNNGKTWYATQTGYGWDVDIFAGDELGSCCNNLGCTDFVSKSYCDSVGGGFLEAVACSNRTDEICGAGVIGACCTGVIDSAIPIYCSPSNSDTICDILDGGEVGAPNTEGSIYDNMLCYLGECVSCCSTPNPPAFCGVGTCTQELVTCCLPLNIGDPNGDKGCFDFNNGCTDCESMGGVRVGVADDDGNIVTCEECRGNAARGTCCIECPIGCNPSMTQGECTALDAEWISNEDDCVSCGIYEEAQIGTPNCLTDQTLLQCNLINGVFIPATENNPNPCSPPESGNWPNGCAYNACEGPVLGSCCDSITGNCYGAGMREIVCINVIGGPNAKWTEDGTCDDCCEDKVVRGACCLCNDSCRGQTEAEQLTPQECSALGGVFMGIDTLCGNVNCAITGSCDCECNSPGCCDCPAGHPSRSPCCDDSSGSDCCAPGDDCCQSSDPCCDSSNDDCTECFSGDCDCDNPPCDDDNDGDGEGFQIQNTAHNGPFRGVKTGNYPGSGMGGGNGGNSDVGRALGSCCVGYRCQSFITPDDSNTPPDRHCFGQYKAGVRCENRSCKTQKYNGACCCMTYYLDCTNSGNTDDTTDDCRDCVLGATNISCTNCGFNGNISGFSMPLSITPGPNRPLPDGYNVPDVYNPPATGDKRRTFDPDPYITPDGIRIPYSWTDCCMSPGGCATRPCSVWDRREIAEAFPGAFDGAPCPSECIDPSPQLCDPFCGGTNPTANPIADLRIICGECVDGCDHNCCDNPPLGTDVERREKLENANNRSQCRSCDCIAPPICTNCTGNCQDQVFSSCKFIYDWSNVVNYEPANDSVGGESTYGTACSGTTGPVRDGTAYGGLDGSICEKRKTDIWGHSIQDNQQDWDISNPWNLFNATARESMSNRNSSSKFRKINKSIRTLVVKTDNTTTIRLVQR